MSGAAIAVLVAKARRRIVGHFEAAGALSPESAMPFTPRDRHIDRRMFSRLRRYGAVVETTPGLFYLDHAGLARFRVAMLKRVGGVLALGAAAVAAVMAFA